MCIHAFGRVVFGKFEMSWRFNISIPIIVFPFKIVFYEDFEHRFVTIKLKRVYIYYALILLVNIQLHIVFCRNWVFFSLLNIR